MIRQAKEFAQKASILAGTTILCGAIGFYAPLFTISRDIDAVASAIIFAIIGVVVGSLVGWVIIRRNFD